MEHSCRICGNADGNKVHRAREMMFGTREEFDYVECSSCGTLQIAEVPDLAKHYPPDYLSFSIDTPHGRTALRRFSSRAVGRELTGGDALGKLILKAKPGLLFHFPPSLRERELNLSLDSRVLDFGCGKGQLLQSLHYFGFTDLTGVDAFIESDIEYPTGVRVLKCELTDLEGGYDVVMAHHSFEHLPEPLDAISEFFRILKPGGRFLLRMPVVSEAWERYGTDWVQMDPPRHLFLFTEATVRMMAENAGFVVKKVVYDSTDFQFWGSEQYTRDIPLVDREAGTGFVPAKIFSDEQIAEWANEAARLNREGRGDAASYYLEKPTA